MKWPLKRKLINWNGVASLAAWQNGFCKFKFSFFIIFLMCVCVCVFLIEIVLLATYEWTLV